MCVSTDLCPLTDFVQLQLLDASFFFKEVSQTLKSGVEDNTVTVTINPILAPNSDFQNFAHDNFPSWRIPDAYGLHNIPPKTTAKDYYYVEQNKNIIYFVSSCSDFLWFNSDF